MNEIRITAPPEVLERREAERDADVQAFFSMRPSAISAMVDNRIPASQAGTRFLFKLVLRLLFLRDRRELR